MQLKYKTKEHIFRENEKDGVLFLTLPILENTNILKHSFSTRIGGVSEGIYDSMNLSFAREDKPENVRENFERMANAIQVKPKDMVFSNQTHSTNVKLVQRKDCGNGIDIPNKFDDVDGMITNEEGVCLVTFYADCVPVFFVDPVQKAIGLTHSGWRGTVGKIGERTIQAMCENFDSKPKDIIAAIGPSICQDCYEVSENVIEEFREVFSKSDCEELFISKENGKYQLNLWQANKIILQSAGIQKENLAISNLCTCCNEKILFSHRASHGKRGNLAAFLALNEKNKNIFRK